MMENILDKIVRRKHAEVAERKEKVPVEVLKESPLYHRSPVDFRKYFREGEVNVIAEFKRKSPSRGVISEVEDPVPVVTSYRKSGAMMSSVLTDSDFFGGSLEDLRNVKNGVPGFPLLRKDFMIDGYQLHEAKAYGADVILLIAAILSKDEVKDLAAQAADLGLGVLLELHSEEELGHLVEGVGMLGVNNRNLKDFSVSMERSVSMVEKLPDGVMKVAESGIRSHYDIEVLMKGGFDAFLIGEALMTKELKV